MRQALIRTLALAKLVLIDGLRRHALQGLMALALGVVLSGLFFFAFVPRDIGRVLVDFVVTVGWFAGMVFLFFHAVQMMSWGEDRRIIHTLLAHPLSRTEYVLGLFAGLLSLLVLFNLLLGAIGLGVLALIKSWVGPAYFSYLGLVEYFLAWLGVMAIEAMMLSAIVVFSGLLRGGFAVLLVTISYYLISNGVPVAIEFILDRNILLRRVMIAMTMLFPDFSRFDYKGLVVSPQSIPTMASLMLNLGYAALYCVLLLTMAAGIYNRRDLK